MAAKVLTTTIVGKQFKDDQAGAIAEFWRIMKAAPGGRKGDPKDYIDIADVERTTMGWEVEYVADVEEAKPKNQLKPISANLAEPEPVQAPKDDGHEREVLVSSIMVTHWNPRKMFDADKLKALSEDIEANGLINAITVRPKGTSRYELVAGERRLRAFRLLGRERIPAKVRELTDEQVLNIMLSENVHREDLNSIEEAHHLKRVLEVGKLTQTDLAKRIGKSQEWVSQRLRLAEAPAELQEEIIKRLINPTSAAELLVWQNTEHFDILLLKVKETIQEEVKDGGLGITYRQVREIIKSVTEPDPEEEKEEPWAQGDTSTDEALALIRGEASLITERPVTEPEPAELPWLQQPVVISDEECDGCGMYIPEFGECGQKCQTNEDCEKFYEELEPVVIFKAGDAGMIALPPVPVANPEALVAMGLCKDHGKETETKGGMKFCKGCGVSVAEPEDQDEDVPAKDETEAEPAARELTVEDKKEIAEDPFPEHDKPEASGDTSLPAKISCRCRDYATSLYDDPIQSVIEMMRHVLEASGSSISPKCHQKALHRLAAAMKRSPEVMAVLRDQFTGGMI